MINRRTMLLSFAAATLFSVLVPATAGAQEPWWGNRRNDDNYRRSGYLSDHDRRTLRDTSRRINDRGKDFQRNLDRFLDSSRYDDTRREDRINDDVREFRNAAQRFRDRAGNERERNHSVNEARQLLRAAARIDRYATRVRLDGRTRSDWQQIRADLRTVANIYNLRAGDFDDDDRYGRDDDPRNPDRRRNNTGWRWPF